MEEGGLVSFLPKACVMVAPPSPSYGAPGRVRVGQLEGQTSTARPPDTAILEPSLSCLPATSPTSPQSC